MATVNTNPIIYKTTTASSVDGVHDDSTFDAAQLPLLSSVVVVPPGLLTAPSSARPLDAFFPVATSGLAATFGSSSAPFLTPASPASPGSLSSSASCPRDPWDAAEVFELVRAINDPEHPLTLEQLHVIQRELISVDDAESRIDLRFTPTIPHCSMATLIGLCLRVQLIRSLPQRFKVDIRITEGAHSTEDASQCSAPAAAAAAQQHRSGALCAHRPPSSLCAEQSISSSTTRSATQCCAPLCSGALPLRCR